MENLLNQRFDIYLTQKIMNEVEESYKRETRGKMRYVLDDLKVQYRLLMNDFFKEHDNKIYECEFLTFTNMRERLDRYDSYFHFQFWKCYHSMYRHQYPFSDDWRDITFHDMIQNNARRRRLVEMYDNIVENNYK